MTVGAIRGIVAVFSWALVGAAPGLPWVCLSAGGWSVVHCVLLALNESNFVVHVTDADELFVL